MRQRLAQAREAAQLQRVVLERQIADLELAEKACERQELETKAQEVARQRETEDRERAAALRRQEEERARQRSAEDRELAEALRKQEQERARLREAKAAEARRLDSLARVGGAIEAVDLAIGELSPEDQLAIIAALYGGDDDHKRERGRGVEERKQVEVRKQVEEAATHALFRGVGRGTMEVKVDSVALRIGTHCYTRKECGASHDGHSNLCGYLSFTDGDGAAAVLLKQKLAPMANGISHDLGRNVNFAGLATLMENEVIMAYVLQEKTPVCVYNSVAQTAVTYYSAECVNDMVFLHCDGGHFQRLVRA